MSVVTLESSSMSDTGKMSVTMQRTLLDIFCSPMQTIAPQARYVLARCIDVPLFTFSQQALRHQWLSGQTASDHNLVAEIKAYMAKARLRRGIEIIKLANRIEALKMQEDDEGEAPGDSDVPGNPKVAAKDALSGEHAGEHLSSPEKVPEKRSLSKIAKGAIFREVVFAKVKELKAAEAHAKTEADLKEKAKRNSTGH